MEFDFVAFFVPRTLGQLISYLVLVLFLIYLFRSKGKFTLGPLSFEPATDKLDHIETALQAIASSVEQNSNAVKEIEGKINLVVTNDEQHKDDINRLRLESIKTQILLDETPYQRKLYLFDTYKKLGGNSWMDEWMDEYRVKMRNTEGRSLT